MASTNTSKKIHIQLFGGEKDGYNVDIELKTGNVPEMFYVWRGVDDEAIRKSRGARRAVLADRLACLAYTLVGDEPKAGVAGSREYRYKRYEPADRKLSNPAV